MKDIVNDIVFVQKIISDLWIFQNRHRLLVGLCNICVCQIVSE